MASRLNLRFISIFLAIVLLGGGGISFLVWRQFVAGPGRNFSTGERYEKEGDFRKAVSAYGRAVNKDQTNPAYLEAMDRALTKVVPLTVEDARDLYNQLIAVRMQRGRATPTEAGPWIRALETVYDRNTALQSDGLWRDFSTEAGQVADRLSPDAPQQNTLKFWKAIGFTRRGTTISDQERQQAEAWLKEVVQQDPGFDQAWLDLIRSQSEGARKLQNDNRVADARARFEELDRTLQAAKTASPDGLSWRIGLVERLQDRLSRREAGVTQPMVDAARSDLAGLEDRAIRSREGTFQLAVALLGGRTAQWTDRASKLLVDRLAVEPSDMLSRRLLMLVAMDADKALAERVCEETLGMATLPVSLDSIIQDDAKVAAISGLFNAKFGQFSQERDPVRRAELLKAVLQSRDRAVKFLEPIGRRGDIRLIEAKSAMAEDRISEAAAAFDEVLRTQERPSADTYLYAAMTNLARRELGTALRICNEGLDRNPGTIQLLMVRAEIEGTMGRFEQAKRTLQEVQAIDPANPRAKDLMVAIGRSSGSLGDMAAAGRNDAVAVALGDAERRTVARDYEGAAAVLKAAIEKSPREARLYAAIAQLYGIAQDNAAEAKVWIDRGLAVDPKDRLLLQLQALVSSRDPVERAIRSIEAQFAEPRERDVAVYVALVDLRPRLKEISTAPRSSEQIRKEAAESLARLESILPEKMEAALKAGAGDEALVEAVTRDALARKDMALVERAASEAEKRGEKGIAAVARSRVLLVQDKPQEAMRVLLAARQAGDQSAVLLKQLSLMYEREGNLDAAKEALQLAYDKRPNDIATARLYALLLDRAGDRPRALETLRALSRANPDNREILDALLRMEVDIGDRAGAVAMRRRLFRDAPAFRDNAAALANMLLQAPGEPAFMQEPSGAPLFKPEEIRSPSPGVLERMRQAERDNIKLGLDILGLLMQQDPDDANLAVSRARALVRHGKLADGDKALREDITRASPQAARLMWIGLGALNAENGQPQLAKEPFDKAIAMQDPATRDSEVEIADFWFSQRQWDRARKVLEPIAEAEAAGERRPVMAARLAEICLNLRDHDAADKWLTVAEKDQGSGNQTLRLLRGSIESGRAQSLTASGRMDEARAGRERAVAAYRAAVDLAPNNAMAWTAVADAERNLFLVTREPARLTAAMIAVDRALSILSTYQPAVSLKRILLLDQGDVAAASSLMERFVRSMPQSGEGRQQWIELLMREGSVVKAVDVAEEGARLEPRNPRWPMLVGEIQKAAGREKEAIQAFDRAYAASPEEVTLVRAVNARLERDNADWADIVAVIKANPQVASSSVTLQGMLAAALVNARQRDAGLQALRSLRTTIEDRVARQGGRPDLWDVWYAAVGQAFRDQPKEAEAFVLNTLAGKPRDFFTNRGLARIWRASGKEGMDESLRRFTDAVAAAGEERALALQAAMEASEMCWSLGDCPKAAEWCARAVEIAPEQPACLNNAAYIVVKCQNDVQRAEAWARKANELSPGVAEFLDTLGYVLVKAGKPQEALEPLQRSVSMEPSSSGLLHLAEALAAAGRKDDARATLRRIDPKKLTPDQEADRTAIEKSLS